MALLTRSSVMGLVREDSEGVLKELTSGDEFIPLRDGFSFSGNVESIDSDELVAGDIGASKSFVTKQTPAASVPAYIKHSGVEGQEPETGILFEAMMGDKTVNAVEYTVSSATTAVITVADGTNFEVGQGLLIKDGINGYSIRNIASITGNELTLNYELAFAPASGVGLGKDVLYKSGTTHPTFSAHRYQAAVEAAYRDAMAGCRVSSGSLEFTANDFGQANFDFAGIQYYYDQVRVDATNFSLDLDEGAGELNASIAQAVYESPIALARELETKLDAVAVANITVVYNNTSGKYTITSDGGQLDLLWSTGTNTATTIGSSIGFDVASDDTGALSYESDNGLNFDPEYSPLYDDSEKLIIKGMQLLMGDANRIDCRKAINLSFSIDTPKTDVETVCAPSGVSESIINERNVTMSATIVLDKYEAELFDKFINNTTTQCAFNAGTKVGGQWVAGKSLNVYMGNMSITAYPIADNDGYQVINVEAKGFVTAQKKDVYINFL